MKRFEVRTTGKVFSSWTDQYCLFRRAREVQGRSFRLAVAGEAIVAAAAFVLALWGRQSPAQLLFFFGGSLLITWHAVSYTHLDVYKRQAPHPSGRAGEYP